MADIALSVQRDRRYCAVPDVRSDARYPDMEAMTACAPRNADEIWLIGDSRHSKGGPGHGTAFRMVAGGGFEPPTFGLCDLTQLSLRVGLYLHPLERDARHPVSTPSSML